MGIGGSTLAQVSDVIHAAIADVWAMLADFEHPQRLAPTIDRCTVFGSGVGAVRIVESSRGLRIHERLLESDEAGGRYRYEVLADGDMPFAHVTRYECEVTLSCRPDGSTEITWTSIGEVDGPSGPVEAFLSGLYKRAIENMRAELTSSAQGISQSID